MTAIELPSYLCHECERYLKEHNVHTIREIPLEGIVDVFSKRIREALFSFPSIASLASDAPDSIVAIDLPNPPDDPAFSMVRATTLFHLINTSLFSPHNDAGNSLPYTVYKSAATNIEQMRNAGIPFYSPELKLGYHNDGYRIDDVYFMPRLVSLINLFIGYHSPGSFHFADKRKWSRLAEFVDRGRGKDFVFSATPIVYESRLEATKLTDNSKLIHAFWREDDGNEFVFCNGKLSGSDEETSRLVSEVKDSLNNNTFRVSIPQALNRVIVFRNDIGFHSRDIFEGQFVTDGVTRLYLRAVSVAGVRVPEPCIKINLQTDA